ncbi:GtrA family protein [Dokdonella sp. MW10]|uniref:GtrA family protein n=1 Tax=Dokdonella sp. MW10 TaxID=2992926 RepID=UPI003F7FC4AF
MIPTVFRRQIIGEGLRFLVGGALNTGFTYLVYLLLLMAVRYEVAYVIAYLVGIVTSYLVNALLVFRQPLDRKAALAFPLVYVVQILLGTVLLRVLVEHGIDEKVAPLIVIAATIPLTFLMTRLVLVRKNGRRAD